LGLYFAKNLPKRITPLFLYLHRTAYISNNPHELRMTTLKPFHRGRKSL